MGCGSQRGREPPPLIDARPGTPAILKYKGLAFLPRAECIPYVNADGKNDTGMMLQKESIRKEPNSRRWHKVEEMDGYSLNDKIHPASWCESPIRDGRGGGCRGAGLSVYRVSEKWILPVKTSILPACYVKVASQDFNLHHWPSNTKMQRSSGGLKF